MTVKETAAACGFEVLCGGQGLEREIQGVFCCDLLSWAMSRAPADYAWITVMGNLNTVAVAALADSACVVLAENAAIDEETLGRARQQEIVVLRSGQPEYETARAIDVLIPRG